MIQDGTQALSEQALNRLSGHIELVQLLASMVASEMISHDGVPDAQALHAVAQGFISCAAHTAVHAAREIQGREPSYGNWKESCDEAFQRAIEKKIEMQPNLPDKEIA